MLKAHQEWHGIVDHRLVLCCFLSISAWKLILDAIASGSCLCDVFTFDKVGNVMCRSPCDHSSGGWCATTFCLQNLWKHERIENRHLKAVGGLIEGFGSVEFWKAPLHEVS
jgi:hypothetical protein